MTPQEHRLMVFMFARQTMLAKALLEILRSRGLLDRDDEQAFEALVKGMEDVDSPTLHDVSVQYSAFAEVLGLAKDLPGGKADSPKPEESDR